MRFKPLHPNFKLPTRGTNQSGGLDIYMPEDGECSDIPTKVNLGFAAAIPRNHVAFLLPRSGIGSKFGVELNNTVGVIDADYRDPWFATLRTKNGDRLTWKAGDRILQMVVVPVWMAQPELVDDLDETNRTGGHGSTGK